MNLMDIKSSEISFSTNTPETTSRYRSVLIFSTKKIFLDVTLLNEKEDIH